MKKNKTKAWAIINKETNLLKWFDKKKDAEKVCKIWVKNNKNLKFAKIEIKIL